MKKMRKKPFVQDAERMLNQKTNEDHNQQKPDPKDPNEIKNDPNVADSNAIETDDENPRKK